MEIRTKLAVAARNSLTVSGGELTLRMPTASEVEFSKACATVTKALETIDTRLVIPREIQDILGISSTERHRWLKDGRLPSAGTRSVKLRGRAKKVVFHVFDPRLVEALLDSARIDEWREEDAETAAENRRRAAWKAKLKLAPNSGSRPADKAQQSDESEARFMLRGWAEFEREGPR